MTRTISLEEMFTEDYLKLLIDKEKTQTDYVTSHVLPHEEYADRVGYIRALREAQEEFRNLLKGYFDRYK